MSLFLTVKRLKKLREARFTVLFLLLVLLTGCISGFQTAGDAYREEEVALLRIMADNIIDLEKKKDYTALYSDYASRGYKQRVSERRFLKLTHCVETHMGEVLGHNVAKVDFKRENKNNRMEDLLTLEVYRKHEAVTERYVLVDEGVGFRIDSFRWLSDNNEPFKVCMKKITPLKKTEIPAANRSGEIN